MGKLSEKTGIPTTNTGFTNVSTGQSGASDPISLGYNFVPTQTTGVFTYKSTDDASRVNFASGTDSFVFQYAGSGTQGTNITWSDFGKISTTGVWIIGPTGNQCVKFDGASSEVTFFPDVDSDRALLWNYNGFNGGTTRGRPMSFYNGKRVAIGSYDVSGSWTFGPSSGYTSLTHITRGGLLRIDGLNNATSRPAIVGGAGTQGAYEIRAASGNNPAGDDGFMTISAGGGTTGGTKSFISLSGYSTIGDMDRNITFGTCGAECGRISNDKSWYIGPVFGTGTTSLMHNFSADGSCTVRINAANSAGSDATLQFHTSGTIFAWLRCQKSTGRLYASVGTDLTGPYVVNSGTSWTTGSDSRMKDNILPIQYGLNQVLQMEPKEFEYKANLGKKKLGFVAQEMISIIPEVVDVPENEEAMMGIDYQSLVPILVKSIQEQQTIIEQLKTRIETLENK